MWPMIEAKPQWWAELIFRPYILHLLKKHFYGIHLTGTFPQIDPSQPLLILPNHSTWWDGFFVYLFNLRFIKRPFYIMMLEEQLRKNPFFKYVGAFGITQKSISSVKAAIRYTSALLNQTKHPPTVCMFPQGELLPWHQPVHFQPGVSSILRLTNQPVQIVLLCMHAVLLDEQRPHVFFKLGELHSIPSEETCDIKSLQTEFQQLRQTLFEDILNQNPGTCFYRGTASVNQKHPERKKA